MKRKRSIGLAFAAGALFATGLAVGGMTNPSKVRSFLDFAGVWDPTLLFVMGGAVTVYFTLHRFVLKRGAPLFDTRFHLPTRRDIDARLIADAAIFGVGWGLGGYCPGPGIASSMTGAVGPVVFVVAMIVGMWIQRRIEFSVAHSAGEASANQVVIECARRPS
ncbi:MAG: YeeE/YedE family protein [Polyangiaceae bacterium]|nr:YeeE/YedE family protein [Polyangiaceae bacterium]